jgi:hypothetical protein
MTIGVGVAFVVLASLVIVAGPAEERSKALLDMAPGFAVLALAAALVIALLSRAGDRARPPG